MTRHERFLSGGVWGTVPRVAVIAAAGAVLVLSACSVSSSSSSQTTAKPVPTVTADRLDSLLLTVPEANTVLRTTGMQLNAPIGHSAFAFPPGASVSPPECATAVYPGVTTTYSGSGFSALSSLQMAEPVQGHAIEKHHVKYALDQVVASFPSADQAINFVKGSVPVWKSCANETITVTGSDHGPVSFDVGDVVGDPPTISLQRTQQNSDGWTCQHALSAESNVVIDVHVCAINLASDEAGQTADKIATKVTQ